MKVLLDRLGIDIWEVVDAAATKPFGFQAFYPGPGLGGHCIPIDPFYLTWKAREVGLPTRFIELAGEINQHMPDYVIQRLAGALNGHNKSVKGSRILVLGMAYKPDIDDIRESPSLELIEKLLALQAQVDYNDPHIPQIPQMRRHRLRLKSVDISPAVLAGYDCILIATHHCVYNWQEIADNARLIVDTRGVMRKVPHAPGKVVFA
jgi:UDP-N-acetyl-D-glucosamine dehydrogenase